MDVVTQLEQACAHGCVLLSETFAVALRPADPAFSGDGIALRRASDGFEVPPPAAPAEGGWDDLCGSGIAKEPKLSASHRLSMSTSASSLPHGSGAPSVAVRRLGLHRTPAAPHHGNVPGAAGDASGSLRSVSAASAPTGDAFDLLPASDMDLVGARHAPKRGDLPGPLCA